MRVWQVPAASCGWRSAPRRQSRRTSWSAPTTAPPRRVFSVGTFSGDDIVDLPCEGSSDAHRRSSALTRKLESSDLLNEKGLRSRATATARSRSAERWSARAICGVTSPSGAHSGDRPQRGAAASNHADERLQLDGAAHFHANASGERRSCRSDMRHQRLPGHSGDLVPHSERGRIRSISDSRPCRRAKRQCCSGGRTAANAA